MLSLERYMGAELRWLKRGFGRRVHELVGEDGTTFAKLTVEGILTSHARLETDTRRYMLIWTGFMRRRIKIIDLDGNQQLGELYLGIRDRGEFRLNGRRYSLRHNLLGSVYTVTDDVGSVLFRLTDKLLSGKGPLVSLGPDARMNRDLMVLIAAARYAVIMISQEGFVIAASA